MESGGDWSRKLALLACSMCAKMLLIPAYFSTDFEVHRNWKAITWSLPLSRWYFDETSQWTLDYPPMFAYFECVLARFASVVDPGMLDIGVNDHCSRETIIFQRLSVIFSGDLSLFLASTAYGATFQELALLLAHPALVLVDNVHFQYNGFVIGVLMTALSFLARTEPWTLPVGAILLATAINLKQTMLFVCPVVTAFLVLRRGTLNAIGAAVVAAGTSAAMWAPFSSQTSQLLKRLFPFGRGLLHSYWAANVWALAAACDLVLSRATGGRPSNITRGLVDIDDPFSVLPSPTPAGALALTVMAMFPSFVAILRPSLDDRVVLMAAASQSFLSAFLFGWHVHEKAILLVILPLSTIALRHKELSKSFRLVSVAGTLAIMPLLIKPAETLLKYSYLLAFSLYLYKIAPHAVSITELAYIIGMVPVETYASLLHRLVFPDKYHFIPQALIACYSAIGVCWSWILCVANLTSVSSLSTGQAKKQTNMHLHKKDN